MDDDCLLVSLVTCDREAACDCKFVQAATTFEESMADDDYGDASFAEESISDAAAAHMLEY